MAYTNNQLKVVFGDGTLGLGGDNFHYIFSYERGGLESMLIQGKEWLYRTPTPTFWRATTDNDRGSNFSSKSAQWLAADMFSSCINIELTVDNEPFEKLPIAPYNNKYTGKETAKTVSLKYTYQTNTIPSTTVDVTYTVTADGKINIKQHFTGNKDLPDLPALGLRLVIPTKADSFDYEGLSGETYPDRMAGATRGTYHVEGLSVTPYIVPQECGMHMDTSKLTLTRSTTQNNADNNPQPFTLTINKADKNFNFSALPYTPEELENATHQEELPLARRTVLTIFGAVRGVGGIDSWGTDVENKYHISAKKDIDFQFNIEINK